MVSRSLCSTAKCSGHSQKSPSRSSSLPVCVRLPTFSFSICLSHSFTFLFHTYSTLHHRFLRQLDLLPSRPHPTFVYRTVSIFPAKPSPITPPTAPSILRRLPLDSALPSTPQAKKRRAARRSAECRKQERQPTPRAAPRQMLPPAVRRGPWLAVVPSLGMQISMLMQSMRKGT